LKNWGRRGWERATNFKLPGAASVNFVNERFTSAVPDAWERRKERKTRLRRKNGGIGEKKKEEALGRVDAPGKVSVV